MPRQMQTEPDKSTCDTFGIAKRVASLNFRKQTKGTGASGSFSLGEKTKAAPKKAAVAKKQKAAVATLSFI